jgi:hypothetical protein
VTPWDKIKIVIEDERFEAVLGGEQIIAEIDGRDYSDPLRVIKDKAQIWCNDMAAQEAAEAQ